MKNLNIKNVLALILGVQASFSIANAQESTSAKLRYVENLSATERFYLKQYLSDLENQGYQLDLKHHIVAIDENGKVYFLRKDLKQLRSMKSVEEPSCMSGGIN